MKKSTYFPQLRQFLATYGEKRFLLAMGLLLSLLMAGPLLAQSLPDAEVEFYIKSRSNDQPLTVGDQLTLRLEVIHPEESRVALPQLDREWEGFYILEQTAPQTVNHNNGMATTGKDIVVTAFRPGYYKTPDVVVTHRLPNGVMEELASPVIQLRITSVLTNEDDIDLRDLKSQAEIPVTPLWVWGVGILTAIAVLVAAIVWAVWWFYIRREQPEEIIRPEPVVAADPRPPEEIAFAELNRIANMNLPAQNEFKHHYSLIANCLRQYVENRYKLPALEQTTAEIRYSLRQNDLPDSQVAGFIEILSESDLVKFAKHKPVDDMAYQIVEQAREVVKETTPKRPPQPKQEAVVQLEKQP